MFFDKDTYGADLIPEIILPMAEACNFGSRYFCIVNTGKRPDFYGFRHIEICGSGKEILALITRLEKELGMVYRFAEYEEHPTLSARGKYYFIMSPHNPFYRIKDKTGTFDIH